MALFNKDPRPGDLIEIVHKDSTHWAVYVGDGDVVHLAPPEDSGDHFNLDLSKTPRRVVRWKSLKDLVGSSPYKINNHLDHRCPPLPEDEILRRAEEKKGADMENSVGDKEFVTHLRYGLAYIKEFFKDPNPGDMIEYFHKNDTHWAIYMGDGDVVHLVTPGDGWFNLHPILHKKKVLTQEPLKSAVGDSPYRVNNYLDSQCPPLPQEELFRRVKEKIGALGHLVGDKEFVTHLRHGVVYLNELFKYPSPGDLIEIFKENNTHWAIYMGGGNIVHLAPQGDSLYNLSSFSGSSREVVKQDPLKSVVDKFPYRINNHLDGQCPPLPADEILRRAKEKIGADMGNSVGDKEFFTHLRYDVTYSQEFFKDPNPGDLVEIFRKDNSHWAIYMGDGDVVHLFSPSYTLFNFKFPKIRTVKREPLKDMVGSFPYRVNNHLDSQCPPLSEDEILRRAKEKIGTGLRNNLGHKDFVTQLRHGKAYIKKLYEKLNPGDLIEIFYKLYQHWAIYVGDGYIVHLTADGKLLEVNSTQRRILLSTEGEVRWEPLEDVLGDCRYQVNNNLHELTALPVEEVISRAMERVGKNIKYKVLSYNCEHFATDMRYGKPCSQQVENALNMGYKLYNYLPKQQKELEAITVQGPEFFLQASSLPLLT